MIQPVQRPLSNPDTILNDKEGYERFLRSRTRFPLSRSDTASDRLYRLYEHLLLNHRFGIRNEIEYFWWESEWLVCDIPDPQDPDAVRYAVLACLPHLLVRAFNCNIERGLHRNVAPILSDVERKDLKLREPVVETLPGWASEVPPAPDIIKILNDDNETLDELDV